MSNRALGPRLTYQADAGFLVKLAASIQRDHRFSNEQKKQAVSALNMVSIMFMGIPPLNPEPPRKTR